LENRWAREAIGDGKIKATPPFGRFAMVGQRVTACRRKGDDAAFPENSMESTRIAPPIAVLRVLAGRMRDGKGKAWPSRPRIWLVRLGVSTSRNTEAASRFRRKTNDINDQSAIRTPPANSLDRVASF
jgi:hypothetical protein